MRKIFYICLILLSVFCFISCSYNTPSADVTAVVLGDTEKQVIEKAGYPTFYWGVDEQVQFYALTDNEDEGPFRVLFLDEQATVYMTMTAKTNGYGDWEIAEGHKFTTPEEMIETKAWHKKMGRWDVIGSMGPGFTESTYGCGLIYWDIAYPMQDGGRLVFRCWSQTLSSVMVIDAEGHETIVWDEPQVVKKNDGTPVL